MGDQDNPLEGSENRDNQASPDFITPTGTNPGSFFSNTIGGVKIPSLLGGCGIVLTVIVLIVIAVINDIFGFDEWFDGHIANIQFGDRIPYSMFNPTPTEPPDVQAIAGDLGTAASTDVQLDHTSLLSGLPTLVDMNSATTMSYDSIPLGDKPNPSIFNGYQLILDSLGTNAGDKVGINFYNQAPNTMLPYLATDIYQYPNSALASQDMVTMFNTLNSNLQGGQPTSGQPPKLDNTQGTRLNGFFHGNYYAVEFGQISNQIILSTAGGANPTQVPDLNIEDVWFYPHALYEFSEAKLFPTFGKMPSTDALTINPGNTLLPGSGWLNSNDFSQLPGLFAQPFDPSTQVWAKEDLKNSDTSQEETFIDLMFKSFENAQQSTNSSEQLINSHLHDPLPLLLQTDHLWTRGIVFRGVYDNHGEADCLIRSNNLGIISTARSMDTSPAGLDKISNMAESVCQYQFQTILGDNTPSLQSFASLPGFSAASNNPPLINQAPNAPNAPQAPQAGSAPVKLTVNILAHRANCRFGPAVFFGYKYGVEVGNRLEAIGRNSDGTWVEIQAFGGHNTAWIYNGLIDGSPTIEVTGDVMTLPDTSANVALPELPGVVNPPTGESIKKQDAHTVRATWKDVPVINSTAQAASNTPLYIVQYWTNENGKSVFHEQGTNETHFDIPTNSVSGPFQITRAHLFVQQTISPGNTYYAGTELDVTALAGQ